MKTMFAAAAAAFLALPAQAAVLTVDTGWVYDQLDVIGAPTQGSVWTLVLAAPAHFSLTDSFMQGDTFTITGDIAGVTTVFAGPNDIRATGDPSAVFGWLSADHGKFTTYLGAGTYNFSITGDGQGGVPAGLYLRADTTIPEASTWAMLIMGFGLVGTAVRRRKTAVAA